MRTHHRTFIHHSVFRWLSSGGILALAGATLPSLPAYAQSQTPRACTANWQCRDAQWQTLDWCDQGECQHLERENLACQLPAATPGCWFDLQCADGDPNTVNWCGDYDWRRIFSWGDRSPGRCHSAPRDGSACDDSNAPQCRRNRDCADADPQTRNWCHEGECIEAQIDQANCVEPESECQSQRDCVDDDQATVDWCYLGECYHAPVDGAQCEPTLADCEPVHVVLEHSLRGAVNNPAAGGDAWRVPGNGYQIRYVRGPNGVDVPLSTSFTCFDTASLSGTVLSAYVEMTHSKNSYDSPDPSESVALLSFDQVGCDEPALSNASDEAPDNWSAIFQDSNEGAVLAEFIATQDDQGTTERIPLNQAGLESLQSLLGSSAGFGLGGTLTSADGASPGAMERVFAGTDGSSGSAQPSTKLVITLKPQQCADQSRVLLPVDVGYFARAQSSESNDVIQSFHFESPAKEHKFMPVGNRNIDNPLLGKGNVETRAYSVWDLSGIENAVSAKFRIWAWQPSLANNFSGAYTSDDASETISLFSIDNHSAQEIINAPFEDDFNHSLDIPIFEDLGEGTLYGARVHTLDDELVGLSPAFRADPNTVCEPVEQDPGAPCGKWLEYELNADAIAAINASNGLWGMGHTMTTIDANPLQIEWTNNGVIIDMATTKASYPSYLSPEPQLIIQLAQ